MSKTLEKNSTYAQFDSDGDGIVTDDELSRSERMMQIENMDKLADQQRVMSWVAIALVPALIVYCSSPLVSLEKLNALNGILTTFSAGMTTIVVTFMAATAYIRRKME